MSYSSAAELLKVVGTFAERQPTWAECIVYDTRPDERFDITLVSQRVYGNRDDFLAVMAAAGLDSVEQELTARRLVLPTLRQLEAMKAAVGFVTSRFDRSPAQVADPIRSR